MIGCGSQEMGTTQNGRYYNLCWLIDGIITELTDNVVRVWLFKVTSGCQKMLSGSSYSRQKSASVKQKYDAIGYDTFKNAEVFALCLLDKVHKHSQPICLFCDSKQSLATELFLLKADIRSKGECKDLFQSDKDLIVMA